MSTHHMDVVRALPGALAALHGLATAHISAASIIGRVPGLSGGLDKLRAFPGVALPGALSGGGADGDEGGGDGGDREPDYQGWGEAIRDLVLCTPPSHWVAMSRMAMLCPDELGYVVASVFANILRQELPMALMRLCRAKDISPVEAIALMDAERRAADCDGRAVVRPIAASALEDNALSRASSDR